MLDNFCLSWKHFLKKCADYIRFERKSNFASNIKNIIKYNLKVLLVKISKCDIGN